MKRRGWFLLQLGCGVILALAAPTTLVGLDQDLRGPYEVHAAPASTQSLAVVPDETRPAAEPSVNQPEPVRSP